LFSLTTIAKPLYNLPKTITEMKTLSFLAALIFVLFMPSVKSTAQSVSIDKLFYDGNNMTIYWSATDESPFTEYHLDRYIRSSIDGGYYYVATIVLPSSGGTGSYSDSVVDTAEYSGPYYYIIRATNDKKQQISSGPFASFILPLSLQDSLAVLDIRSNLDWAKAVHNYGWVAGNPPICEWYGVTAVKNRVTGINLAGINLSGTISPSLKKLTALTYFNLGASPFVSGPIPDSLNKLSSLSYFNVGGDSLYGPIPLTFTGFSSLKYLNLSHNWFTGPIDSLVNFTSLDTLYINDNNLSGPIPPGITNLRPITTVDISYNNFDFDGMAATASQFILGKFSPQRQIRFTLNENVYSVTAGGVLSDNTYTWYKNEKPYAVNVGDSVLTVPKNSIDWYSVVVTNAHVPSVSLYVYPLRVRDSLALVDFYDSTNGNHWGKFYTGWKTRLPLDKWTGVSVRAQRVKSLFVGGAYIYPQEYDVFWVSGRLPQTFESLALDSLGLAGAYIYEIPPFIGNMISLKYLYITASNYMSNYYPHMIGEISGEIPASFANLTNLTYLDLNHDNLIGNVPSFIGDRTELRGLNLSYNRLTDTIPASIGNDTKLHWLDLSYNNLTGKIPASLTNCTALQRFILRNNHLSGALPPIIGNLSLIVFDVTANELSGDVSSIIKPGANPDKDRIAGHVEYNNFNFSGMYSLMQKCSTLGYSPQSRIPIYRQGNNLYVYGGDMANDTFRLFKDGQFFNAHIGDSAFAITSTGKYVITVTNKNVTNLTLTSDTLAVDALPVTLLNFTAARVKTGVQLNWQTAQEINTASYVVERSTDGAAFTSIGTVAATGNSTITQAYQYTDADAAAINSNTLYYRLNIADKDGSYSYSKIVSLQNNGSSKAFIVYPNPARTSCIVQFTATAAKKYTIALTTADGKVIKRINIAATAGINRVAVDVAGLPQATYFIHITSDKETTTLKVVRE